MVASGLTEEALILRLRSAEYDFVERKSRSDRGAWLQTAVAFANSAPIGWPAVLFVGVDDSGAPQQRPEKLEDLAKSVSDVLDQAYPAIYRHFVPLHFGNGGCLAVIVPAVKCGHTSQGSLIYEMGRRRRNPPKGSSPN